MFFILLPLLLFSLHFLLGMLLGLVPSFFSPLFFASCIMSSSATEDGSPIRGTSLVGKEVRGIWEFGNEEELSISSLSSVYDSERTKDFLVSAGERVGVQEEMTKMGGGGGS